MLIVFCLGLPIFALFMLWKYKNSENQNVQMVLRFFYDGYKPSHYYWEFIILMRKFLIVVAINIGAISGVLTQLYGFLWVIQAGRFPLILIRNQRGGNMII